MDRPTPRRRDLSGVPTESLERTAAEFTAAIHNLAATHDTIRFEQGLNDVNAELVRRTIEQSRKPKLVQHPVQRAGEVFQLRNGTLFFGSGV